MKFAAYVPELLMSQIEVLYFYNTNFAFKQSANKFENMSKVFSHIKVQTVLKLPIKENKEIVFQRANFIEHLRPMKVSFIIYIERVSFISKVLYERFYCIAAASWRSLF